jgi:hypothetical protein
LRLSVDGELRDGEYAAIASLAIDDSAVYIRCRLSSLGPEETQVLPFGGQREDEPAGLSSRIIVDAKGKRRLWIASEGAAYRLVVEEIVKTGEPR